MSTGYDFAILKAQIKYCKGGTPALSTRHYTIERTEAQEDMEWLAEQEQLVICNLVLGEVQREQCPQMRFRFHAIFDIWFA